MDVYEMDIETFKPTLIFNNDKALNFGGISNDKRYLVFGKTDTRDNSDYFTFMTSRRKIWNSSPNTRRILITIRLSSQPTPSNFIILLTKTVNSIIWSNTIFKPVVEKSFKKSHGILHICTSRDWANTVCWESIRMLKLSSKYMTPKLRNRSHSPSFRQGKSHQSASQKSEQLMSFYHGGAKSPSDLYAHTIGERRYSRLTNSMNPEINPSYLAEAEVIRYKSFDGMEIPAVYYKPPNVKQGDKIPALVWVHGGPGGQSRVGYRALIQYLANHGYAVLAVNNRGSSGYGKTFQTLDDQAHGEGDLDDCVSAKDFLISTGYIDENKIGIIGGSYGGYMVMAALAFRPEDFEVGVNIYGVTNWIRTLKSIPPWWEAARLSLYREMGNPETQEDYLYNISPLFHAKNIVKPVMVLQGANDPRVLQVESDEMVAAVRNKGVVAEYIVFEDEGHGFVKKENQIKGYGAILQFLDNYLKKNS